jgi:hypothetical protein
VSEAALPGGKLAELPLYVLPQRWGGAPLNGGGFARQGTPTMALSPDGKRLVVSRAIGQTFVLNTDTGEAMPTLGSVKDALVRPSEHAFSGDGRLLAMSGITYESATRDFGAANGGVLTVWEQRADFLIVWDTQTGKALKTWKGAAKVAFNPALPLLAIFEPNGPYKTRVGFWDFASEIDKK